MAMNEANLKMAARRAYEGARWRHAFTTAAFIAPVVLCALVGCSEPLFCAAAGALLIASIVFFKWRGEAVGRGVVPGMIAGLVPFPLPFITLALGHPTCSAELCTVATLVCLGGGLGAGVLLGRGVANAKDHLFPSAGSAMWIALLTGSLSCVMLGVAGFIGLTLGIVFGATPVIALARSRA